MRLPSSKGVLAIGVAAIVGLMVSFGPARDASAAGEQNGRVKGTVKDATSGAALPSVTVVISGKGLPGGPKTVMSDDLGRYEIADLPPGLYAVEVSYPGMVPFSRPVEVRPGQTAPLHISWSTEQAGMESVRVTSGVPLTKPDSTQTGTVLNQATLAKLPTGRSYQNVAQLVPGVSGGANPNVKGGMSLNNRYLIDGLDVTDPVTQTFSANLTFDSTDAVDVLTGGMEAQYNSLAGVINVVSSRGSEDWHANASVYVNHEDLSASGNFGPQIYNGQQPFNDTKGGPTRSAQANFNVGGPLVKRHLWFNVSYELRLATSSIVKGAPLGVAPYDIQHPAQDSANHLARVHLTYAPNQTHRLTLMGSMSPGAFNNVNQSNFRLGVAENRQNQDSNLAILTWDFMPSTKVNTTLQVGFVRQNIEFGPQGRLGSIDPVGCDLFKIMDNCTYNPGGVNRPQHVNALDNTVWYQGDAYQNDNRYRIQVDPSISIRGQAAGSHDIKIGVQSQYNWRTRDVQIPGNQDFTDASDAGTLLEGGLCNPASGSFDGCFRRTDTADFYTEQKGYGASFYIQDRWWTPLQWLTVVPGFRFDWGMTTNRKGDSVTNMWGLGPRLGLIGDVTRDGRTIVFAYYGRHNEVLSLLPASNIDGSETAISIEREFDPMTNDFTNVVSMSGGEGNIQVDKDAKTPHKDEITAGVRREIVPGAAVGVEYTWNRLSNLWAEVEINRIWDPTGLRVVGWKDPQKVDINVSQFTTPDDNSRQYHGFSIFGEGQPSPNWNFGASWTASWTYGHATTVFGQVSGLSGFDNIRQRRFFDGFLAQDLRHYLRGYGSYTLLRQLSVGANFGFLTGTPMTKTFWNATDGARTNYRSPLGTEPGPGNDQKTISEFRVPERAFLDLRLVWNILPHRFGHRVNAIVDVFNVLNTRTVTAVTSADIPTFGSQAGRQAPRRVQLAINYAY